MFFVRNRSLVLISAFLITACFAGPLKGGDPLAGCPILLSCHEPTIIVGQEVAITDPSELLVNIDWHAGSGAIFVLNVFTLTPKWDSSIDHMLGVVWPEKKVIIDERGKSDRRFNRRKVTNNNSKLLHDHGTDPVRLLSERAKEKGVKFFVRFRMNDHHLQHRKHRNSYHHGYFWLEHPEFADNKDRFNYEYAEVRQYFLDLMEEVIAKYPLVEGLEMDFMRSPSFFKADAPAKAHLMTDFVRKARGIINRINGEQQRDVVLGACVPITVAAAHSVGLDLKTWASEGLVDYLVPKRYQTEGCETFPNLDVFRQEVGGAVKIFGHYNDYNDTPRLKEAAAMSALLQEEKADGVHLFNVWNDTLGLTELKKKQLRQRLALMKPDAHLGRDKFYGFGLKDIIGPHPGNSPLPTTFSAHKVHKYDMTLGEDFSRFTPETGFFGIHASRDSARTIGVTINGHKLELADVTTGKHGDHEPPQDEPRANCAGPDRQRAEERKRCSVRHVVHRDRTDADST